MKETERGSDDGRIIRLKVNGRYRQLAHCAQPEEWTEESVTQIGSLGAT